MAPTTENMPVFQLGSTEGPYKGSLAWAAALQTPSYVISDGNGKLHFRDKMLVSAVESSTFLATGITYKVGMSEFDLEREIGRGQFGVVLLVRHRLSDRIMALKDVRLEISEQSIKQITTEIDILTKASSSYIIEFFGAFHNQASVYICLEYMDAGSLENLYRRHHGIPEEVLAAIAYSVVMGMRFLYRELRIMHRDVKPSNILLNSKGEVKLCDFGISGYLVRSLARTHIGSMCYMAPERISVDKPIEYTAKADVWSLGVTLFESATCEPLYAPQNYDSPFAQLMALISDPSPQLPATFSPPFCSFVDACLQKDPKNRASFEELLRHQWLIPFTENKVDHREVVKSWLESLSEKA